MNLKVMILLVGLLFSTLGMARPVNVNTASVEEIAASLKGVGPSTAMAISDYCKDQKCSKPEDLLNVKGVGAGTLEKIKEDLRF